MQKGDTPNCKSRSFLNTKLGQIAKVSKKRGAHEEKIRISFKKTNGHTAERK